MASIEAPKVHLQMRGFVKASARYRCSNSGRIMKRPSRLFEGNLCEYDRLNDDCEYDTPYQSTELPNLRTEIQDFCRTTLQTLLALTPILSPDHSQLIVECAGALELEENIDLILEALQILSPSESQEVVKRSGREAMKGMLMLARSSEAFKERCSQCLSCFQGEKFPKNGNFRHDIADLDELESSLEVLIQHLEDADFSSECVDICFDIKHHLKPKELTRILDCFNSKDWEGEDACKLREIRRYEARLRVADVFIEQSFNLLGLRSNILESPAIRTLRSDSFDAWFAGQFFDHIRFALLESEGLPFIDSLTTEYRKIVESFPDEDLTEDEVEQKLAIARIASNDIYSEAKALRSTQQTRERMNRYLLVDQCIVRVRSGQCQYMKFDIETMYCWFNCDDSVIYSIMYETNIVEAIDLKRDFVSTFIAEYPQSFLSIAIAVFESSLIIITEDQAKRYNLHEKCWEDLLLLC
mmetsp:Transcript_11922/g.22860  ORF Transcript_11922/g.22860 Transcript_11922/m.22860 type:complete len:470 (-) Transcript_11922:378-1787(-)